MPLLDFDTNLYIARKRQYIDSQQRTPGSKTPFNIVTDVPDECQNVQSIEMVNYNMPHQRTTFFAATSTAPGNNLLDIRLQTGVADITFTVTLPTPYTVTDKSAFAAQLLTLIETAMDAVGNATINTGTVATSVVWTDNVFVYLPLYLGIPFAMNAWFLFGTGPSRGYAPERVFGFDPGVDTFVYPDNVFNNPDPALYNPQVTPVAYHQTLEQPYQYIDVFIQEVEPSLTANNPVSRIFVPEEDVFYYSKETTARPRLLTSPLRVTKTLNTYLLLESGIVLAESGTLDGWDLTLDILHLSQSRSIPQWVQQRLQYS